MIGLFCFVLAVLASSFKSKLRLEAENAVLRHQLIVLRRRVRGRTQPKTLSCQGQRDTSVDMIRAILDRWIQRTEPTKTRTEWKVFVGKQNFAGAVLYSLKGAMPCR